MKGMIENKKQKNCRNIFSLKTQFFVKDLLILDLLADRSLLLITLPNPT